MIGSLRSALRPTFCAFLVCRAVGPEFGSGLAASPEKLIHRRSEALLGKHNAEASIAFRWVGNGPGFRHRMNHMDARNLNRSMQRTPHIIRRSSGRICSAVLWLSFTLLIVSSGCVRRRMMVRTSPPGATVSVDNQVIGVSPAATPFVYYGTREFRIEADGYQTETIRRKFKPPWYQWPGVDFFAETLWPGELRDERIIDVTLVPKTTVSQEEVLARAESLRGQSSAGLVTAPRQ